MSFFSCVVAPKDEPNDDPPNGLDGDEASFAAAGGLPKDPNELLGNDVDDDELPKGLVVVVDDDENGDEVVDVDSVGLYPAASNSLSSFSRSLAICSARSRAMRCASSWTRAADSSRRRRFSSSCCSSCFRRSSASRMISWGDFPWVISMALASNRASDSTFFRARSSASVTSAAARRRAISLA